MAADLHWIHGIELNIGGEEGRESLLQGFLELEDHLIGGQSIGVAVWGVFRLDREDLIYNLSTFVNLEVDIGILVHTEYLGVIFIGQLSDVFLITVQRIWGRLVVDARRGESMTGF